MSFVVWIEVVDFFLRTHHRKQVNGSKENNGCTLTWWFVKEKPRGFNAHRLEFESANTFSESQLPHRGRIRRRIPA